MEALQAQQSKSIQPSTSEPIASQSIVDPEATFTSGSAPPKTTTTKKVVKGKKPKLTSKEKKERAVSKRANLCSVPQLIPFKIELERIIGFLPLEFRGSDVNLRRHMETVIEGIWDSPSQTVKR